MDMEDRVSHISRLKKQWGYETNVPRCSTCVEYLPPRVYVKRDSIPVKTEPLCKKGDFFVAAHSCCDHWHSKTEVLA